MLIDCESCQMRDIACGDCVVTALFATSREDVHLDTEEQAALAVLADSGLVSPLRLVPLHPVGGGDGRTSRTTSRGRRRAAG